MKPYANPEPSDLRPSAFPRKSRWAAPGSRLPMECHGAVRAPGGATHTGPNGSVPSCLAEQKGRVANGRGELPLTSGIYLCQQNFPYCLLRARCWSKCRRYQSFQFSHSVMSLTLCDKMNYGTPGFLVYPQCPELAQTHVHRVGMSFNHLILCYLLFPLPSIFPSMRVFSNESALHIRWPKCWSCSFSISPSNEHSGLIFFRMDWLDLLAVQGTIKSLLQHHSSKASIFRPSAFFMVQLSYRYMTTGKTIALMRWTFVSKVMSLLFNIQWAKSLYKLNLPLNGRNSQLNISRLYNYMNI